MGFWGKLGKIALKVAPYAAMAIPGVGIPLGMAIQGGIGAAQAKAGGAGWKGTLLGGGLGAASGAVGAGALKGIGPSSGVLSKVAGGAAGKTAGLGVAGKIGGTLGNLGRNVAASAVSRPNNSSEYDTTSIGNRPGQGQAQQRPTGLAPSSNIERGFGGRPQDMRNPNLSISLNAGRDQAIRNQPFRAGYDIYTQPDDETAEPIVSKMPPIYPNKTRRQAYR